MQGLLGDLIPKGEKFGSKQGYQRGQSLQAVLTMGEVANMGRNKGGVMDLGGGHVNIG